MKPSRIQIPPDVQSAMRTMANAITVHLKQLPRPIDPRSVAMMILMEGRLNALGGANFSGSTGHVLTRPEDTLGCARQACAWFLGELPVDELFAATTAQAEAATIVQEWINTICPAREPSVGQRIG